MAESKRLIEVFTAGCPACEPTVAMVRKMACPSCEVRVLEMADAAVAERAKELGVKTVPAFAVDGRLADCCRHAGPTEADLRAAGVGQS